MEGKVAIIFVEKLVFFPRNQDCKDDIDNTDDDDIQKGVEEAKNFEIVEDEKERHKQCQPFCNEPKEGIDVKHLKFGYALQPGTQTTELEKFGEDNHFKLVVD